MAQVKKLDLALQGGGAHGAYTWGVIDRLLADERIEIEGISGTSAGAMNGVVMADALTRESRQSSGYDKPNPSYAPGYIDWQLEPGSLTRLYCYGSAKPRGLALSAQSAQH